MRHEWPVDFEASPWKAMHEFRFVPRGWAPRDFAHLHWAVVRDAQLIRHWRRQLRYAPPVGWHQGGHRWCFAEVSYHRDKRPQLVVVAGFR